MVNPQSACVSIVTGIEGKHTVCSNESAMLVLESLAFLLFEDFCGKTFKKKNSRHTVEQLEGHFVLKQKKSKCSI